MDKFGPDYFKKLASKGGKSSPKEAKQRAGVIGGFTLAHTVDPDYYSRLGRKSNAKQKARKQNGKVEQICPGCGTVHTFVAGKPNGHACICGEEIWYIPK